MDSSPMLHFLDSSPTAWHAVENIKQTLQQKGYEALSEKDNFTLKPGKKYFFVREDAALVAVRVPKKKLQSVLFLASHTDSPALKLKPNPEDATDKDPILHVTPYGGPLLLSWFNRPLGLAGRITYENSNGKISTDLVNITDYPCLLPHLAIHLQPKDKKQQINIDVHKDLKILSGITKPKGPILEKLIGSKARFKRLINYELLFYPLESATIVGWDKSLLTSYRVDNLSSVYAKLAALTSLNTCKNHTLDMALFLNHEEIGSRTFSGAHSPFVSHLLERIALALNIERSEQLKILANSYAVSLDVAHAHHPNYPDSMDTLHAPRMGDGIVLKSDPGISYANSFEATTWLKNTLHQLKLPMQIYQKKADQQGGSSLGPLLVQSVGVPTVDMGCAQLSMHAAREVVALRDIEDLVKLLTHLLKKDI